MSRNSTSLWEFGAIDVTQLFNFIGFGAIDGTKSYKSMLGTLDVTKLCNSVGFEAIDVLGKRTSLGEDAEEKEG